MGNEFGGLTDQERARMRRQFADGKADEMADSDPARLSNQRLASRFPVPGGVLVCTDRGLGYWGYKDESGGIRDASRLEVELAAELVAAERARDELEARLAKWESEIPGQAARVEVSERGTPYLCFPDDEQPDGEGRREATVAEWSFWRSFVEAERRANTLAEALNDAKTKMHMARKRLPAGEMCGVSHSILYDAEYAIDMALSSLVPPHNQQDKG
jgi:hypothetical protein